MGPSHAANDAVICVRPGEGDVYSSDTDCTVPVLYPDISPI